MSESLRISSEGRLRRLTLNRPERRNALDMALCRRLIDAVGEAASDPAVGALLLDAGGKDFCAGMDLKEVLEASSSELLGLHQELFSIGSRLRKPMLAAVHGAVLAGGLGLALNAHVVVAASDAKFGLPETRIGLWPYVIFPVVAAATGLRKATELALTGRIVDAEEAGRIGIVDVIVQPQKLQEEARRIALEMALGSAEAIGNGLAFVEQILGVGPDAAAKAAVTFREKALNSADFREGVLAFREKRKPVWPSHNR
jgi:enoyl-CoA hydratase/carnithine racemase